MRKIVALVGLLALATASSCSKPSVEGKSRPVVDAEQVAAGVSDEQVEPARASGAAPLASAIEDGPLPPLELVVSEGDLVARVVLEPVDELLGDYDIGGFPSANAFYLRQAHVVKVLAVAGDLDEPHRESLSSGMIDVFVDGPNVTSPLLVEAIEDCRSQLGEQGTGVAPPDVELLVVLRAFDSHGRSDLFIANGGTEATTFYWGDETLVRPAVPLVGDLPGLELDERERAAIRGSIPSSWPIDGLTRAVPTDDLVELLPTLSTRQPGTGGGGEG